MLWCGGEGGGGETGPGQEGKTGTESNIHARDLQAQLSRSRVVGRRPVRASAAHAAARRGARGRAPSRNGRLHIFGSFSSTELKVAPAVFPEVVREGRPDNRTVEKLSGKSLFLGKSRVFSSSCPKKRRIPERVEGAIRNPFELDDFCGVSCGPRAGASAARAARAARPGSRRASTGSRRTGRPASAGRPRRRATGPGRRGPWSGRAPPPSSSARR